MAIRPGHPHVNQIITGAPMIATQQVQQPANPRIACIHNYRAQVGTNAWLGHRASTRRAPHQYSHGHVQYSSRSRWAGGRWSSPWEVVAEAVLSGHRGCAWTPVLPMPTRPHSVLLPGTLHSRKHINLITQILIKFLPDHPKYNHRYMNHGPDQINEKLDIALRLLVLTIHIRVTKG